jgi:predicted transcriptional regulator
MAKRIEIGLTNQAYKRVEELAASADMKPTEVARLALRHTLADPQGFLSWLNRQTARVDNGATAVEHAA